MSYTRLMSRNVKNAKAFVDVTFDQDNEPVEIGFATRYFQAVIHVQENRMKEIWPAHGKSRRFESWRDAFQNLYRTSGAILGSEIMVHRLETQAWFSENGMDVTLFAPSESHHNRVYGIYFFESSFDRRVKCLNPDHWASPNQLENDTGCCAMRTAAFYWFSMEVYLISVMSRELNQRMNGIFDREALANDEVD